MDRALLFDPILPKPAHGQACNGCGRCCADELCPLAFHVFRGRVDWHSRCPALLIGTGRTLVCGMVARPRAFAPTRVALHGVAACRNAARLLIGAGLGCDGQQDGEPADEDFRRRMRDERARKGAEIAEAKAVWGIP